MAKDYVRKRQTRQKSNAPRQLVMLLTSFLCGYLTATVFDFTSLSSWVNKNILNHANTETPTKVIAKQTVLPKPKFEFYTLLSKDNSAPVPVNRGTIPPSVRTVAPQTSLPTGVPTQPIQTASVSESKPLAAASKTSETYLIQIASFNKRQDAEHLKASLVLRGFDVTIASVAQNNITWFRVIVGPFSSRKEAEKAHEAVARSEHMKGMIRKMDS